MFKRIGLTIVACGVMLGAAGFADAAIIPVRNRTTVQRVIVRPHHTTIRRGVHVNHRRFFGATKSTASLQNAVAGRYRSGHHRHHHRNWQRMV